MALKSYIRLTAIIFISLIICCSCSKRDAPQEMGDEMSKCAENLIDLVLNKNEKQFREMFSSDALLNSHFDDGVKYTFEVFSGTEFTIENYESIESTEFAPFGITETVVGGGDIVTDETKYKFHIEYYVKSYYNPILRINLGSDVGKIRTFMLVEDTEDAFLPWEGWGVTWPGIYNPNLKQMFMDAHAAATEDGVIVDMYP